MLMNKAIYLFRDARSFYVNKDLSNVKLGQAGQKESRKMKIKEFVFFIYLRAQSIGLILFIRWNNQACCLYINLCD